MQERTKRLLEREEKVEQKEKAVNELEAEVRGIQAKRRKTETLLRTDLEAAQAEIKRLTELVVEVSSTKCVYRL